MSKIYYQPLIWIILFINISYTQNPLTIGIVGDQFGSYDASKSYDIMEQAINKIADYDPDIIVHVGDFVESVRGINSFDDYRQNFDRATNILNRNNTPWILSIGDHGVVPPKYKTNSSDRSREEWFLRCSKIYNTPIVSSPYYSLNVNGYHFIALYSLERLHTDPRWGPIYLNDISDEQINWLKKDLDTFKDSNGIIIVVHHPMWYVWSNWIEVHNLLKKYPVIAVIAGHYHYDQDEGEIDGIRYLVMGSTGGVVKDTDANSGGVQEYGIMKINNKDIEELKLYETNSDSLLEWTPRITMDRIQAISVMLDNLYGELIFTRTDNKLLIQNSDQNLSDSMNLSKLANPIDLPIEIQISSKDIFIYDQTWIIDETEITGSKTVALKPGYNIDWANYSNVGQWYDHLTIWKAKFTQSSPDQDNITVSFTVNFSDTKERIIKKDITYKIR